MLCYLYKQDSTILAYSWDGIAQSKRQAVHSGDTGRKEVHSVEFRSFNEASMKNKVRSIIMAVIIQYTVLNEEQG